MTPSRCPQCGLELPADAPEGLCPRCVLQAGLAPPALTGAYSASAAAPTPVELQPHFPQLEILELIGKGGMGAVYKARQVTLDRLVAVKILPQAVAADPAFAERFQREARALARLNHPHIVTIHDFGQAEGFFHFVMEYVEGINLRQAIRAGKLQPQEALRIVPQICEALQYAHDEGIVHRDIKPENILLDRRGRVKMADFGLAKLLGIGPGEATLTGTQQAMGTVHYMAPEQIEGARNVDHRADIYSLGVTFYEMLTGELPLGRFAPPSKKVHIDVRLDEVVLRSLEKDPEQRYQHASEVKTEVEAIGSSAAAPPATPLEAVVREYWPQGKIAAIKAYREKTGAGLAEAKRAVEEIARKLGLPAGDVPASLGRSVALAALIVVAVGLFIWVRLSAVIWVPLAVGLFLGPACYRAWKHRGTPEGRRAAILAGVWAYLVAGTPVLSFLADPAPLLRRLYDLTGAAPGPHDVLFLRGVFVAAIVGGLIALMRAFALERAAWVNSHPAARLPGYRHWVGVPGVVLLAVYAVGIGITLGGSFDSVDVAQATLAGAVALVIAVLALHLLWVLVDMGVRSRRRAQPAPQRTQPGIVPSAAAPQRSDWNDPRRLLIIPGIGLLLAALVDIAFFMFLCFESLERGRLGAFGVESPWLFWFLQASIVWTMIIQIQIGLGMIRVEAEPPPAFYLVASMLIPPGALLALPCGIWTMVLLGRPDVKAAYATVAPGEPAA